MRRSVPIAGGEIPLASKFLSQIPDHSITLFDKGFWSADLLLSLSMQGQGRHWLIPERKNLKSEVIETYAEDDVRVRMKVSPQARKNNPMLPEYWEVRQVSYAVDPSLIHIQRRLRAYSSPCRCSQSLVHTHPTDS